MSILLGIAEKWVGVTGSDKPSSDHHGGLSHLICWWLGSPVLTAWGYCETRSHVPNNCVQIVPAHAKWGGSGWQWVRSGQFNWLSGQLANAALCNIAVKRLDDGAMGSLGRQRPCEGLEEHH